MTLNSPTLPEAPAPAAATEPAPLVKPVEAAPRPPRTLWRLRNFRFLMVVMGLGVFAMILEITDSTPNAGKPLMYPYLMRELYPERGESLFYQGMHAIAVEKDYPQAKELFEKAMATGLKTEEELYYRYAEVLIQLKAPQSDIDAAIAKWKYHFPFSQYPTPGLGSAEPAASRPVQDAPTPTQSPSPR